MDFLFLNDIIIIMIIFFVFIFGLLIGSFLNCVIYRLEKAESFLKGRSYCPHCQHSLAWQDLIPIFSFLILKGKCRYCQKRISIQYPLVELTTAIIFLLIFNFQLLTFNFQNLINAIFLFVISPFLIIIFVYDLKHYLIPDKITYPAIFITFFYQLFKIWNMGNWEWFRIWNLFFSVLPAFFFLALIIFSKETWMGWGDFKLAILLGLLLSWPNILVGLFLAFFFGAIIGIGLIILKKKQWKSEIPFGPFLVFGNFLALFWGEEIINWYLSLIL